MKDLKRIGLVIDYMDSEYAQLLLKGVRKSCKQKNIQLFIFCIGTIKNKSPGYYYQYLAISAFLTKNNIDGIIFVSGLQTYTLSQKGIISFLKSYSSIPIVNICSEFPGIPSVIVDCTKAYDCIVKELVNNQDCKRFFILDVASSSSEAEQRIKAINLAMEKYEITDKNVHVLKSEFEYRHTLYELEKYFNEKHEFNFDAVIALNDEMAFACSDFCKAHKIKVPQDVVIVGFDDSNRAIYTTPSITSINQELPEQGYKACEILNQILEKKEVPALSIVQSVPVFRNSTRKNHYSDDIKKQNFARIMTSYSLRKKYETATDFWYNERNIYNQVMYFYSDFQTDITLAQLQRQINSDLKRFGITGCGIVLYNSPVEKSSTFDYFNLPHKAFMLSAFDYGTNIDTNGADNPIRFDPNKKIFPEGLLKFDGDGFYAIPLFHNAVQYGYILFRAGTFDITIYSLLFKIISTIIATVYSNNLIYDEKALIEKKYNQLDFVASTDELTGLYNRRGLFEAGKTQLIHSENINQSGLVIYCDMDGLKKINDTYGHEAGDKAIIAESIILKGNFRSSDILSRIGGDEFAIICPGLTEEAFYRIKNQICEDCQRWSETSSSPFDLSLSMGYIKYPDADTEYSLTRLLSKADEKLYEEKRIKHAHLRDIESL